MKSWMKKLENSFSVIDTNSYDEEVSERIEKESKKVLRSIAIACKNDGIDIFYGQEDGMIVVDHIDNLVR